MTGALYCDHCYEPEGVNENFLTGAALAMHRELKHRAFTRCQACGRLATCVVTPGGEIWCVDDKYCGAAA